MARKLHFGPARVPSRESPEAAVAALLERSLSACEIDFEGGFWMSYEFAERFGELAREADIALSVHAPLAGFMGHAERGKKLNMATGMLDHSAGIAKAAGAEVVVFHPGFLLGRTREEAIDSVAEQLGELRERLAGKGRDVPFGIEVMGRVRELGRPTDVVEISRRLPWVRPVLDFAHMHATSDGGFTVGRAVRRGARGGRCRARGRCALPHPLLGHPVREPKRDEASPLRRRDAARRAARRGTRTVRAAGDRHLRIAGSRVHRGDPSRPRGVGSDDGDPPDAARDAARPGDAGARDDRRGLLQVRSTVIASAYVGLIEITRGTSPAEEHLGVAFELSEPAAETEEGDRELRLVADRFYDTMPAEIQEGGCNFLEPGGISAWAEKAQKVFSR